MTSPIRDRSPLGIFKSQAAALGTVEGNTLHQHIFEWDQGTQNGYGTERTASLSPCALDNSNAPRVRVM